MTAPSSAWLSTWLYSPSKGAEGKKKGGKKEGEKEREGRKKETQSRERKGIKCRHRLGNKKVIQEYMYMYVSYIKYSVISGTILPEVYT